MNGRTAALLGLLLLGPSRPAAALDAVFEAALARAQEKLATPGCRLVLADFHDASGRTLEEKLTDTDLPAPEFLRRLDFRDGRSETVCRRGHVDAFTSVGGSTVWICPGGSLLLPTADARNGANALIHEMLHALGLAENPPTSGEITQRVRHRCGL